MRPEIDHENRTATYHLRNYLGPNGCLPYSRLVPDLEAAMQHGYRAVLISVPGFCMLFGHPDMSGDRKWSDGTHWYKTAKDALDKRDGEA